VASLRLPSFIPHKPSPKQAAFLIYNGLEALYGGAAGGGKTDALLMGALQYVDQPSYAALLLRRSYTDLALPGALMDRSHEWLKNNPRIHWNRETHTWTFPSGATLSFGYIASAADKYRYQSAEFQYIGWDEVTEFPDEDAYTFMFSRLRRLEGSPIPLRVRCASNPVGVGTYWVRKRFVDQPSEERIFLPATFYDNPHIDHDAYLVSLQQLHPALQKRLIEGSWESIEDAAYPEFHKTIHVIPNMRPPESWRRWEGMDYGVSNPTAWLAAALSPEGDTVIYGEYYSTGLVTEHSSKILTLRSLSWGQPTLAVGDPSIRNRTGFGQYGMGETIHSEFSKNGIYLLPAINDRLAGRLRIAELLKPDPSKAFPVWHPRSGDFGAPKLYITEQCANLIEQLELAPLDAKEGEIVDPYWESRRGHAIAALRYLCMANIYPQQDLVAPTGGRVLKRDWGDWRSKQWRTI
jgi:hypothetical protein